MKKLIFLLLILFFPNESFPAAITSAQDGNALVGSTWVGGVAPGDGDTAIIASGHDVTLASGETWTTGESGATGSIAITLQGSATLTTAGRINCRGNLYQQRGTTIIGNPGGSIYLDAPTGSQYKWYNNSTGSGTANLIINGTGWGAEQFFTINGDGGRGGSYGWVDFSDTNTALYETVNASYVKFIKLGNSSVKGFFHYVNTTGSISTINYAIFDTCGRVDLNAGTGGFDWNHISIIAPQNTSYVGVWNALGTAGSYTRSLQNITVYNPSTTVMPLQISGRMSKIENIIGYNIDVILAVNTRNTTANKIFLLHDRTSGQNDLSIYTQSAVTVSNSVFLKRTTNQHSIGEIVYANPDGNNQITGNVFDGDDYFLTDTGDVIIYSSPITARYNIMINGTGVATVPQAAAGSVTFENNTMHKCWGQVLGESSGWATSNLSTKNNLFVSQGEAVHQLSAVVSQTNWTLDYNNYYDMTVASTPHYSYASGSYIPNISHPVGGFVSGLGKALYQPWWSSGSYGDAGKGANDISVDPGFVDSSRTVRGYGAWADVQTAAREMVTINGVAYDGSTTTATTKSVDGVLAYIRGGFTPTNMALATSGEGGTYIGAVEPASSGSTAIGTALMMGM